jgi:DNA-binding response OmpR family regulator
MQDNGMPTVLVVDDAADTRQILNETLKPHCVVLLAKNGEQALDRARNKQPDLILLDVVMPGMSGFEVLANLQADATTRDIPVIFLTGMDTDADVERGLQQGAVDYIRKPFVPEVVVARTVQHARRAQHVRQQRQSMIHSDTATGLPNRDALLEKIAVEVRRAARVGSKFALLAIELRHDQRQLLTTQFDALLAATQVAAAKALGDWVPWIARSTRQALVMVLPDIQDIADNNPQHQIRAVVATAAQECGWSEAVIAWRVARTDGDATCIDAGGLLVTVESALACADWQAQTTQESCL